MIRFFTLFGQGLGGFARAFGRSRRAILFRQKGEDDRTDDAGKRRQMIPTHLFLHDHDNKPAEDSQRDDFLDDFQLDRRKVVMPPAICGHHEAVFKESDPPTGENYDEKRLGFEF